MGPLNENQKACLAVNSRSPKRVQRSRKKTFLSLSKECQSWINNEFSETCKKIIKKKNLNLFSRNFKIRVLLHVHAPHKRRLIFFYWALVPPSCEGRQITKFLELFNNSDLLSQIDKNEIFFKGLAPLNYQVSSIWNTHVS